MLVYLLNITLILAIVGLLLYLLFVLHRNQEKETFLNQTSFSQGSSDFVQGVKRDYFFQTVPLIAQKLHKDIADELNSAPKTVAKDETQTVNANMNFLTELQTNKDIKMKYMSETQDSITPSTLVSIFLGLESHFNVSVSNFSHNAYAKTVNNKTKEQFVNMLIKKYFQNFNFVNALDAYRHGQMPVYSIVSSSDLKDEDTLVHEASLVLQIIRKAKEVHSDWPLHEIPSFSMSREYQSTQDRLESKAALMFRVMTDSTISNKDTFKSVISTLEDDSGPSPINETIKKTLSMKAHAMDQANGYANPFLVTLMRSILEKTGTQSEPTTRFDESNQLVQYASRTGYTSTSANVDNYAVVSVRGGIGSGYIPNTLRLISDGEVESFRIRLRDVIMIMMKHMNL